GAARLLSWVKDFWRANEVSAHRCSSVLRRVAEDRVGHCERYRDRLLPGEEDV
ncbi:unnamed protein product, partial [Ascophyllum nodosum]